MEQLPIPQEVQDKIRIKAQTAPDYRNRFDIADAYEFMEFGYSLAIQQQKAFGEWCMDNYYCLHSEGKFYISIYDKSKHKVSLDDLFSKYQKELSSLPKE